MTVFVVSDSQMFTRSHVRNPPFCYNDFRLNSKQQSVTDQSVQTKNLDSKKVSFYLKPGNASDQRHLVTGV